METEHQLIWIGPCKHCPGTLWWDPDNSKVVFKNCDPVCECEPADPPDWLEIERR